MMQKLLRLLASCRRIEKKKMELKVKLRRYTIQLGHYSSLILNPYAHVGYPTHAFLPFVVFIKPPLPYSYFICSAKSEIWVTLEYFVLFVFW